MYVFFLLFFIGRFQSQQSAFLSLPSIILAELRLTNRLELFCCCNLARDF